MHINECLYLYVYTCTTQGLDEQSCCLVIACVHVGTTPVIHACECVQNNESPQLPGTRIYMYVSICIYVCIWPCLCCIYHRDDQLRGYLKPIIANSCVNTVKLMAFMRMTRRMGVRMRMSVRMRMTMRIRMGMRDEDQEQNENEDADGGEGEDTD